MSKIRLLWWFFIKKCDKLLLPPIIPWPGVRKALPTNIPATRDLKNGELLRAFIFYSGVGCAWKITFFFKLLASVLIVVERDTVLSRGFFSSLLLTWAKPLILLLILLDHEVLRSLGTKKVGEVFTEGSCFPFPFIPGILYQIIMGVWVTSTLKKE